VAIKMVEFGSMTERMKEKAHWARFAEEWIAWARSPGNDAFWMYRRAFARFVGSGTGNALEVGCGEGRIVELHLNRKGETSPLFKQVCLGVSNPLYVLE
jgi:hypothetical protein